MRLVLLAAAVALVTVTGLNVRADELDREKKVTTEQIQLASDLPKTVVIRVKDGSTRSEVLHTKRALPANEASHRFVSTSSFYKLSERGHSSGELDRDSSTSSWYFYCPTGWSYPTYYYYGYAYYYNPYYTYQWGGYRYSYYRWRY